MIQLRDRAFSRLAYRTTPDDPFADVGTVECEANDIIEFYQNLGEGETYTLTQVGEVLRIDRFNFIGIKTHESHVSGPDRDQVWEGLTAGAA